MPRLTSAALLITCVLTAASPGIILQAQSASRSVPLRPTSPISGPQMYVTYCATCHGTKATGDGPAAQALKTRPADLTLLSQKNGGVFPTNHVMSVLQLGVANPAHGSAEMPIWGELFLSLNSSSRSAPTLVRQRVFNLTTYLKQIQK